MILILSYSVTWSEEQKMTMPNRSSIILSIRNRKWVKNRPWIWWSQRILSFTKVATTDIFTHLLESLIYNNLETKIKAVKVSAGAISACLEKFRSDLNLSVRSVPTDMSISRQSPIAISKDYELLVMSCCLMQLLDSVSQNQKLERLMGLEKVPERTSSCSANIVGVDL